MRHLQNISLCHPDDEIMWKLPNSNNQLNNFPISDFLHSLNNEMLSNQLNIAYKNDEKKNQRLENYDISFIA
jgi:hypothetical protein